MAASADGSSGQRGRRLAPAFFGGRSPKFSRLTLVRHAPSAELGRVAHRDGRGGGGGGWVSDGRKDVSSALKPPEQLVASTRRRASGHQRPSMDLPRDPSLAD